MKKKKLEQFSPHLFLVGIVAIVAIVALVLYGDGLTGAPSWEVQVDEEQKPCLDTDKANDQYVAGKVHFENTEYKDYCMSDGKTLGQYYCQSNGNPELVGTYECPCGCEINNGMGVCRCPDGCDHNDVCLEG